MDIHSLISASVRNYQPRFEELLVEEWDRESPINDTPAAEILAALPDGHERAVLLRVGALDITIYRQHVHPETGAPLKTDRDVELVKAYMTAKLIPRLLADDMQIKNAISAALAKRMFAGIEAEREAAGIPDPDLDLTAGSSPRPRLAHLRATTSCSYAWNTPPLRATPAGGPAAKTILAGHARRHRASDAAALVRDKANPE